MRPKRHAVSFRLPDSCHSRDSRWLRVPAGCLLIAWLSSITVAQDPGFEPLFDGRSLSGWEGDERVFRVEEGAIVAGSLKEKVAHNEFLASREEFGDFELRLKARLIGSGKNAGVQFRSQRVPNHFEMIGYQCDMGMMRDQSIWGALYDESRHRKFLVEPDQVAAQGGAPRKRLERSGDSLRRPAHSNLGQCPANGRLHRAR